MVEMVEDEMNKIMQLIQNRLKTTCTQVPGSSVLTRGDFFPSRPGLSGSRTQPDEGLMLTGVGRDHSDLGEKRQSGAEKDPKDQGKRPQSWQ